MTAHKHAEIGIAKLKNMDLVVFFKPKDGDEWLRINNSNELPVFYYSYEYFLCHPKHADVCLHWLNGGKAESYLLQANDWGDMVSKSSFGHWSSHHLFMNPKLESRIKPRKEKRWIAINTSKIEYLGGLREVNICSHAFLKKEQAEEYLNLNDSQLIEIEVEV